VNCRLELVLGVVAAAADARRDELSDGDVRVIDLRAELAVGDQVGGVSHRPMMGDQAVLDRLRPLVRLADERHGGEDQYLVDAAW